VLFLNESSILVKFINNDILIISPIIYKNCIPIVSVIYCILNIIIISSAYQIGMSGNREY
jgi:hypothetical protein